LASDGRVELGSVAANSQVSLIATDTGYALGYESTENFQDIRLLQNALVMTVGREWQYSGAGQKRDAYDGSIIGYLSRERQWGRVKCECL
jgi:large exoprotein involved in heme utilization and adhesion